MSGSTHAHTRPSARQPEFQPPSRRRFRRPRRRTRRLIAAGVILALAAAVVVLLLTTGGEPGDGDQAMRPSGPAARVVGAPIPVGAPPTGLVSSPDGLWVITAPDGRLIRLNQGLSRMELPGTMIGGRPVAVSGAFRSIWVASSDSGVVSRFSPHVGQVIARIPVGDSPVWLAPDDQAIWVVNREDDTLMRIDPARNRVSGDPIRVGDEPTAVGYGHNALWVTNSGDDTVSRVDPRRRRVVATIDVGDHPTGLTLSGDSVWVANFEDDNVQRIDTTANRVVATVQVGDGPNYPRMAKTVWVPNSRDGTLSRIDPRTNRLLGGSVRVAQTADRISTGIQNLWVTSYADQTLTRLEGAD